MSIDVPILTYDYLYSLENPTHAFNNSVWTNWTIAILELSRVNNIIETAINIKAQEFCVRFKISPIYKKQDGFTVKDILQQNLTNIKSLKYTSIEDKKACILIVSKLVEIINNNIDISQTVNRELAAIEFEDEVTIEKFNAARIKINNMLYTTRKELISTDIDVIDKYNILTKRFIGCVVSELLDIGLVDAKNKENYAYLIYKSVVENKSYKQISEELNTSSTYITHMINKLQTEFTKLFKTNTELTNFCINFENYYNTAFVKLTNHIISDKYDFNMCETRNTYLNILKRFQELFIGSDEDFAKYVS